jgi:tetratricopeptide (TPR) repeat protein
MGLVLLACLACTWKQVAYWKDSATLWEHCLQVDPRNYTANTNLGALRLSQGQYEEAETYSLRAINAGLALGWMTTLPYQNLGDALWHEGKTVEAMKCYAAALEIEPRSPTVHYRVGFGLLSQGRSAAAEQHFWAALQNGPGWAELQANLGAALYNQGKIREAVQHLTQALRLNPCYARGHHMLGMACERLGQWAEAIEHYSEAVRLNPDLAEARQSLARVRKSHPGL